MIAPPSARAIGAALLGALVALGASGVALAASPGGWARGIHAWAASAALVLALLFAARLYVAGEAKTLGRPRALAALAALGLLVAAFVAGTVLPWDQKASEAFAHVAAGSALVGVRWSEAPLWLLFHAHALALPALLALAIFAWRGRLRSPDARSLAAPAATIVVVIVAALLWPPLRGPAPIEGLSISRPSWPFLWLVPLEDALGAVALLALPLAFVAMAAGVVLRRESSVRRRAAVLGAVACALGVLTILGAR